MVKSAIANRSIKDIGALTRRTKSHQIGSSRETYLEHMKEAYTVKTKKYIQGKAVLLVDDVLTTGANIVSVACMLIKLV